MAASSSNSKTLIALVVLRNTLFEEKFRSVHVYVDENGDKTIYEREYLFHKKMEYKEITKEPGTENRLFVYGLVFDFKKQKPGLLTGRWECVFLFDRDTNIDLEGVPDILLISRNRKLAAVPSLANDLDIAFSHKYKGNGTPLLPVDDHDVHRLRRTPRVHLFDLNIPASDEGSSPNSADLVNKKKSKRVTAEDVARLGIEDIANYFHLPIVDASKKLNVGLTVLKRKCREFGIPRWPYRKIKSLDGLIEGSNPNSASSEPRDEGSNPNSADLVNKKKRKRVTAEDVARLGIEDIANYFHLPIVDASRKLNVGLTVLKRKCREFGIPRWPHRKIKSFDGLIDNLQKQAKRQEEDEAAAIAVTKRKKMLECEKENIEKKPFLDIKLETKKFRQDVFKRRQEARILEKDCQT